MDILNNSHLFDETLTKEEAPSYSSREFSCLTLTILSLALFYVSITLYLNHDGVDPAGNKIQAQSKRNNIDTYAEHDNYSYSQLQKNEHITYIAYSNTNNKSIPESTQSIQTTDSREKEKGKVTIQQPKSSKSSKSRAKYSNNHVQNNNISLMIPPTMPAFVILGPAKAGTSSLSYNLDEYVDFVFYGREHHYWKNCGNHELTPNEWEVFINDFINPNKNVKMSDIALKFVHGFGNDTKKSCNPYRFYSNWLTLNVGIKASKKYCLHPKQFLGNDPKNVADVKDITINEYDHVDKPVCWFFEKAPSYVRRAFVDSIILANFLPKMKAIMLARNPVKQMISYVSGEYRKSRSISKKQSLEEWMYNFAKDHDSKFNDHDDEQKKVGYSAIVEQCKLFSDKFGIRMKTIDDDDDDEKLILQQYKKIIGGYLYQAKVLDTILGRGQVRQTSFFETTVIFPALLMFIYNYDETFGYKNWNNFRLIQFEWLYSEFMNDGLSMIKCWLQTGDDMKTSFNFSISSDYGNRTHNDEAFYQSYYKCPKVFFNDKKYYKDISNVLIGKISHKTASWAIQNDISDQYKQFFVDFFTPCNNALVDLINHRPEVLLGQWVQWTF